MHCSMCCPEDGAGVFQTSPMLSPIPDAPCVLCCDSPDVALDLVLDVARAGRAKTKAKAKKKKGIGNLWRFESNASAAEAFSFVLKRADKVMRARLLWLLVFIVFVLKVVLKRADEARTYVRFVHPRRGPIKVPSVCFAFADRTGTVR